MSALYLLRSGNVGPPFEAEHDGDTVLFDLATRKWRTGSVAGGVSSVFGRTGAVVAQTGDYDSDQVDNLSSVPGSSVSDALDYLLSNAGAVDSVFGRTGVIVAATGDYDSDQVDNLSGVTGSSVSDALDTLAARVTGVSSVFGRSGAVTAQNGDYTSSQVSNASNLPGSTTSNALNNLNSQLGGTALTDADQTLATTGRYVQVAGSITAARNKTVTPNASPKYFTIEVGTQAFNEVITNGGPNGGSYTVLAGAKEVVTCLSDGTDVNFSAAPLGVEPVV